MLNKILKWCMVCLLILNAFIVPSLLISMSEDEYRECDRILSAQIKGGAKDDGEKPFPANHELTEENRTVTEWHENLLYSDGVLDFCTVSIESLYGVEYQEKRALLMGPFGVLIDFRKGSSAENYSEIPWSGALSAPDSLIRIYNRRETDGVTRYELIDYSSSHVYLIRENADGSRETVSQISGDAWSRLAEGGWYAAFRNMDGSMLSESGCYLLSFVMMECTIVDDGNHVFFEQSTVETRVYEIAVNQGTFSRGILQKKGNQDDYHFLLSFEDDDPAMIYPESKRLIVKKNQIFGVGCSEKEPAQNARATLYLLDPKTNSYIKVDEHELFLDVSQPQRERFSFDFGQNGSGTYKIVLYGEFSGREVQEEYEYYYSIGGLS